MNLQSFTVSNCNNEQLNAVLLCVFQATEIDRTFLAYTLNENLGNQLTRIYLAALDNEPQVFRLTSTSIDDLRVAKLALKCLFEDLENCNDEVTDISYKRVEVGERAVLAGRLEGHHQMRVNQQWVLKLLNPDFAAPDEMLAPPCSMVDEPEPVILLEEQLPPAQTLMKQLSATSTDPAMALNYSLGERQAVTYAQAVPLAVLTDTNKIKEQSHLDSLRKVERNIRVVIGNLIQKKDALVKLEHQLILREKAVLEREAELQSKDKEFNEGLSELTKIDRELDELFQGLEMDAR